MYIVKSFKVAVKYFIAFLRGFRSSGINTYVSPLCFVKNAGKVSLGNNVVLEAFSRIIANGAIGTIEIGDDTTILPYAVCKANNGMIKIGKKCSINDYSMLYGEGGLTIGDNVHIATNTVIVTSEHKYSNLGKENFSSDFESKGVVVEDNVWIGANVTILDGVKIGKNSVIGAGAVVNKDIKAHCIAAGVPARVIREML